METVFWASIAFVLYVYAGYPLLLAIWAAIASRPVARRCSSAEYPTVSVVIAARNEAHRLPARIRNLLEQKYPSPLEIIIVSDGSTDGTAAAVAPFSDRIRLIELPRGGKPLALNAGVAAAHGDIVVFADARQRFAPDAIAALTSNFDDPVIGAVTGELVLDCEADRSLDDSDVAEGVGLYWTYEKWLRRRESRVWSTLGATGAIYALRRSMWHPIPPETLLDDVLAPMRIVLAGKRVVFDDRARAYDRVAASGGDESRRKTRTLAGNYQIIGLEPRLLIPFINPVWVQYVSHKLGRLIVPWCLAAALVVNVPLAFRSWFYGLALMVQLCFYGLAFIGARSAHERTGRAMDESRRASERRPTSVRERRLSL
ncbi:MAG TPA: glycosyltransferase family 2 protein [Vicinamibacterales bacterium]|nr:glycosyltransferase family 2 protein [Vicinamibacterales bacterium]